MAKPAMNREIRAAKLFRNNRSQAVRIPVEFEFSGSRVLIHKEGDRLIIEPEPRPNLLDTLRSLAPLDPVDAFPDVADGPLSPLRNVFL